MSVLYLLMAASLLVALAFLGGFIWAARSGQFRDTDTPSMRMLTDDDGNTHNVEDRKRKK